MKRIEQVVLNLLWNALKYTSAGFVKLACRVTPREDGAMQLLIEVADSGVGISPEEQAIIFERFAIARKRQGRSGRKVAEHEGAGGAENGNADGSVGLGMSICKQLVGLMGGRIWLHSEPDRGTRVFVQLTLERAAAGSAAAADDAGGGVALHAPSPGAASGVGGSNKSPVGGGGGGGGGAGWSARSSSWRTTTTTWTSRSRCSSSSATTSPSRPTASRPSA